MVEVISVVEVMVVQPPHSGGKAGLESEEPLRLWRVKLKYRKPRYLRNIC